MHPHTLSTLARWLTWSSLRQILLPVVTFVAGLSLSGCSTIGRQLDQFPVGAADEVAYTRTGKFSSTTIHVKGYLNTGVATNADEITVRHSNAWMPNLEFVAKGYRRVHGRAPEVEPPPIAPSSPAASGAGLTIEAK